MTMCAPNPRKPPTLTPMLETFPPGSTVAPKTVPRFCPSDDLAVSPTSSLVAAGAANFLSVGAGDVACGAAGGVIGAVTAGGLCGEGGDDCVCASAVASGTATTTVVMPMMRVVLDMQFSFTL